ncbi:hypothetical protein T484DRAFT_1757401 [Baffinella frigidus]|nr:hypothetical protein T484DRAFT_1757401 [Cryptophyta sp. CCMP2293]
MEAVEAIQEIPIEPPMKIRKPRSKKKIEAFANAIAKKAELTLINQELNESKKQKKEAEVEIKKRFIQSDIEPEEIKKPKKNKLVPPPPVESSSAEEESEEEEVIVKRKSKLKKKRQSKKLFMRIHQRKTVRKKANR